MGTTESKTMGRNFMSNGPGKCCCYASQSSPEDQKNVPSYAGSLDGQRRPTLETYATITSDRLSLGSRKSRQSIKETRVVERDLPRFMAMQEVVTQSPMTRADVDSVIRVWKRAKAHSDFEDKVVNYYADYHVTHHGQDEWAPERAKRLFVIIDLIFKSLEDFGFEYKRIDSNTNAIRSEEGSPCNSSSETSNFSVREGFRFQDNFNSSQPKRTKLAAGQNASSSVGLQPGESTRSGALLQPASSGVAASGLSVNPVGSNVMPPGSSRSLKAPISSKSGMSYENLRARINGAGPLQKWEQLALRIGAALQKRHKEASLYFEMFEAILSVIEEILPNDFESTCHSWRRMEGSLLRVMLLGMGTTTNENRNVSRRVAMTSMRIDRMLVGESMLASSPNQNENHEGRTRKPNLERSNVNSSREAKKIDPRVIFADTGFKYC